MRAIYSAGDEYACIRTQRVTATVAYAVRTCSSTRVHRRMRRECISPPSDVDFYTNPVYTICRFSRSMPTRAFQMTSLYRKTSIHRLSSHLRPCRSLRPVKEVRAAVGAVGMTGEGVSGEDGFSPVREGSDGASEPSNSCTSPGFEVSECGIGSLSFSASFAGSEASLLDASTSGTLGLSDKLVRGKIDDGRSISDSSLPSSTTARSKARIKAHIAQIARRRYRQCCEHKR